MSEPPRLDYVTPAQLATRLNVDRMTVTRFIREGHIKAVRVHSRLWLIPTAEADRFARTYRKWKYTKPRRKRADPR